MGGMVVSSADLAAKFPKPVKAIIFELLVERLFMRPPHKDPEGVISMGVWRPMRALMRRMCSALMSSAMWRQFHEARISPSCQVARAKGCISRDIRRHDFVGDVNIDGIIWQQAKIVGLRWKLLFKPPPLVAETVPP